MKTFDVPEFIRHYLPGEAVEGETKYPSKIFSESDFAERPESQGSTFEFRLNDGKLSYFFSRLQFLLTEEKISDLAINWTSLETIYRQRNDLDNLLKRKKEKESLGMNHDFRKKKT